MKDGSSQYDMSEVWGGRGVIVHGVEDMAQDRAQSKRKERELGSALGGMASGL